MSFKYDNDKIIVRGNRLFAFMSVGGLIMLVLGINNIFDILPLEHGYTSADVFGVCFMFVWVLVVGFMVVMCFTMATAKVIIDDRGATKKSLWREKTFCWSEIQDYGLSYSGNNHGEKIYTLYFSKEYQTEINSCKKKLHGKNIKIEIIGDEYDDVLQLVMPFCKARTGIIPFAGEAKPDIT